MGVESMGRHVFHCDMKTLKNGFLSFNINIYQKAAPKGIRLGDFS